MNTRPVVELCDESECLRLEAFLVDRIYEFNANATGYFDGKLIGGQLRDASGEIIAAFNGHTWGGCCVISHLWVHESHRGLGLGRELLQIAEAEAVHRGCEQVVLSTHTFQAPAFYEQAGYEKHAVIHGNPKGHANATYVKRVRPLHGTTSPERTVLRDARLVAFVATAKPLEARRFYEGVLGFRLVEDSPFALVFEANGTTLRVQKVEHVAVAGCTALGWQVDSISKAIEHLSSRGVAFERFGHLRQDEAGIWATPDGPKVAWFRDPDGNTLSLTEHQTP